MSFINMKMTYLVKFITIIQKYQVQEKKLSSL